MFRIINERQIFALRFICQISFNECLIVLKKYRQFIVADTPSPQVLPGMRLYQVLSHRNFRINS